ncbi:hypothetical protein CHS0354_028406 [Potamilus streckersoni]|uniref:Uncharacterized protein n=1 Tax=Potamilus streckersoni TaxID=2493646 RepID=A0AAE0RQ56_9BIVA|nr:hypothetical protein CHS0354_028406 [Potamilus streckersoni]
MYRQLQVNLEKYIEPDIFYRTLRVDGRLQREEAVKKLEAAGISESDIKGMYREGENAPWCVVLYSKDKAFNLHTSKKPSQPSTPVTTLPTTTLTTPTPPTTTSTTTAPTTTQTTTPAVDSTPITSPFNSPPLSATLPLEQPDTPLDEDPATHPGDKRELFDMTEYKWTVVTNKKARIQANLSGESNMES